MNNPNANNDEFLSDIYRIYASKDGHKIGSVITLIGTVATIFTGYGYLFVMPLFQDTKVIPITDIYFFWNDIYTLSLVAITLFGCIILGLLYFISLNFGYTSAKERHVLHVINYQRGIGDIYKYAYEKRRETSSPRNNYTLKDFIPDFYFGLCCAAKILQLFLIIATIVRVWHYDVSIILIVSVIVTFYIQFKLYNYCYRKFLKHITPNCSSE